MDETGSKFLNDFNPSNYQFGGGLGMISDANTNQLLCGTYFSELEKNNNENVNTNDNNLIQKRDFGIYFRRYFIQNNSNSISLNQTLIAPFGKDPIIISSIIIKNTDNNNNNTKQTINYNEVWGGFMYQFAYGFSPNNRRNYQTKNYNVTYQQENNKQGISSSYNYIGTKNFNNNNSQKTKASLWDKTPPKTFLSYININNSNLKNTHLGCSMKDFFGIDSDNNRQLSPTFDVNCDFNESDPDIIDAGLVVQISNLTLLPRGEIKLYFIYGYIAENSEYDINYYLSKYNNETLLEKLFDNTEKEWLSEAMVFSNNDYPEISRELLWDYGQMRVGLSFYNIFNEYVLDQGTWYRYFSGFEGAFRDPLQQMLPLMYTNPSIVESIIRFSLKQIQAPFNNTQRTFNVPYALVGNGGLISNETVSAAPSDLELYLLWSVSEYILATKDIDFLNENISLLFENQFDNLDDRDYNDKVGIENKNYTVLECLLQSFNFVYSHISVGIHGVIRLQTGDWSDTFDSMAAYNYTQVVANGESGLNTAMASYVIPRFIQVLEMINDTATDTQLNAYIKLMKQFATQQQDVLNNVLWNGQWVNRAWVPISNTNKSKGIWYGSLQDGRIHLFPQTWTILSNVLNSTQENILLNNLKEKLINDNDFGAIHLNIPYSNNEANTVLNGTHENGGIWYSQNHPFIIALSKLNTTLAFEQWQKNSYSTRAKIFPQFWPNIWSSSDVVSSKLVKNIKQSAIGTSNWPNFPVFCTHAHSWPLYSFINGILGVSFESNKLKIKPFAGFKQFNFETKLIKVSLDKDGNFDGYYAPNRFIGETFSIVLDLSEYKHYQKQDIFVMKVKVDAYTESVQRKVVWNFTSNTNFFIQFT